MGGAKTGGECSLIKGRWLVEAVFTSDGIIGTCRVWRGPAGDGTLWSSSNAISKMLAGSQSAACTSANSMIRSLAAGGPIGQATAAQNAGAKVIYAGMAGVCHEGGRPVGPTVATNGGPYPNKSTAWARSSPDAGGKPPPRPA